MLKKIKIAIFLICVAALGGCSQGYYDDLPAFKYYTQCNKEVFGTGITFRAAVRGGDESGALKEMLALMEDINSEMSLTLSGSAISRFNALGSDGTDEYLNEKVEISESAYALIEKSVQYCKDTEGAFNIAVYPLAELWNVHTEGLNKYSMCLPSEAPSPPQADEVKKVASHCEPSNLHLESSNGKYYISKSEPNLKIDLGAVAKGFAADECIKIAKSHGVESALINISGNICVLGEWYHPEKRKYVRWAVGVTSPRPRGGLGGDMCALSVPADKTLVTSGDYVRYYETIVNGELMCVPHIVNSNTGLPLGIEFDGDGYKALTGHIVSATLVCEDSSKADAYATAVCLMEPNRAVEFLKARGINGVLVTQDGRMLLVGITESDESGEEYFIQKDNYSAYKKYSVEEFSVG
ncbi:FAD:protein FMN transferase [Pumilibacter muris]|uniref:FAD:protein FMN transferase n=1 Tax=Pumilibacter muris TaxID=2941510 RepID=UPI0020416BF7|nr:FAD:protein FMN transferase [Pumilibacter muris]